MILPEESKEGLLFLSKFAYMSRHQGEHKFNVCIILICYLHDLQKEERLLAVHSPLQLEIACSVSRMA